MFKARTKQEARYYFNGWFDAEKAHLTKTVVFWQVIFGRDFHAYKAGRAEYNLYGKD